jgi:hypothetical protein
MSLIGKTIIMKRVYITLFGSLITMASFGQSLQRVVFNSTGGTIGGSGSTTMVLSVGEAVIGTSLSSGVSVGQGFLGGSKVVTATPTGIDEITADNASVYPNPFSGMVRIQSDADNINVSVYNTMGQEVYNGSYHKEGIDLSYLNSGIYIIHATANNKTISDTKLIKL